MINYTKAFAAAQQGNKQEMRRIGTISVGILTRKYIIDRKGRKRRIRVDFSSPLMSGPGAMTTASAITNLRKGLQDRQSTQIPLTQEKLRKIVEVMTPKN